MTYRSSVLLLLRNIVFTSVIWCVVALFLVALLFKARSVDILRFALPGTAKACALYVLAVKSVRVIVTDDLIIVRRPLGLEITLPYADFTFSSQVVEPPRTDFTISSQVVELVLSRILTAADRLLIADSENEHRVICLYNMGQDDFDDLLSALRSRQSHVDSSRLIVEEVS